jgi:mannose-6-phosphate isomerase
MNERRVEKPWGYEIIWAETKDYVGKILHINPGQKLSLQYHELKEETIRVMSGQMGLVLVKNYDTPEEQRLVHQLSEGDTFHIHPGVIHRYTSLGDHGDMREVSTTELDDVVRLEDAYARS